MVSRYVSQLNGIVVPAHYSPRWYQLEILDAYHSGYKRIIELWHRKAGKDLNAIALMACAMVERVGNYFYVFPKYTQGRKILWEGTCREGIPLLDRIPYEIVAKRRNNDMYLELKNGSTLRVLGADNQKSIDSLVGIDPAGVVFS